MFLATSIQGLSYVKTDGPGIEVGLQLHYFRKSFTGNLYKTFLKELPKTAKMFGERNIEIVR